MASSKLFGDSALNSMILATDMGFLLSCACCACERGSHQRFTNSHLDRLASEVPAPPVSHGYRASLRSSTARDETRRLSDERERKNPCIVASSHRHTSRLQRQWTRLLSGVDRHTPPYHRDCRMAASFPL